MPCFPGVRRACSGCVWRRQRHRTPLGRGGSSGGRKTRDIKAPLDSWRAERYSTTGGYLLARMISGSVLSAERGTRTFDASFGDDGTSQRNKSVAAAAPHNWAAMNPGASDGRIPAKVSL